MARKHSWNPATNHAELNAIEAALLPQLKAAGVETVTIAGKAVAISEAPLSELAKALAALNPIAENAQGENERVVAMADMANRLEKAEADLTTANATMGGLRVELRDATTRATTAEGTVQRMTAERTEVDLQVRSLQSENARLTGEFSAINNGLSQFCLDVNCLSDLKDAGGKILATTATAAEKLSAANLIKPAERLASAKGAVNTTLAKLGVDTTKVPATNGNETASGKTDPYAGLKGLQRVIAIEKAEAKARADAKAR